MSPGVIRVLVLDDRPLVAHALATALEQEEDLRVVGSLHSVGACGAVVDAQPVDVAVVRVFTKDGGVSLFRREHPKLKCVALSPSEGLCFIRAAFEAGTQGFALETQPPETLIEAIQVVHAGRRYFPEPISDRLAEAAALDALTARELDVLKCLGDGLSNGDIADALGLGVGTVKVHIHKILTKLNTENRTEAVARAQLYGLLDLVNNPSLFPK